MEWPDSRFEYLPHIKSMMAKGLGCRSGAAYKPWTNFRTRTRVGTERAFRCSKTGRMVNHRSAAHKAYFCLQERRSCVVSVEEEFPLLNIAETLKICHRLGLEQPSKAKRPEPLVVCFLIREVRDGKQFAVARSLSRASPEARQEASLLDAIAQGCASLDLEWKQVDSEPLTETLLASLMFARGWLQRRFNPDEVEVRRFVEAFFKHHSRASTLIELLEACTARLDVPLEQADTLFRYAAWTGAIPVDFSFKLARDEVVRLIGHGRA